jgi:predicted dehydrogenase
MTTARSSRRSFLASTVAATVASPFLLPSRLWSADVAPSDRLTLGFIGVGTQGRGLMSGFLGNKSTQVVAVCDVDTRRRDNARRKVDEYYTKQKEKEKGKETYKGAAAYNDFRDLLARKDIDAVVIATPDHWHAFIAIAAARAGKDIYCEKPLCQSIHEARAMVNAVRRAKRIFQTGSMQRSSPEFRVGCELVRNGRIGRVTSVEVGIGGPGRPCDLPTEPPEPGLDWDLWLGPAPLRGYNPELSPRGVHTHFPNWRNYWEYGGGMVTDWGAHHFDIAQWGLGMDESGPVEILPATQPNAQEGVRLRYANGVEVIHKSGNGVWFLGTEGKVHVNRGKFEFWRGSEQKGKSTADCEAVAREFLPDGCVRLYHSTDHKADWLASIKSRRPPICDVEVGARTVSVCHLVNLAYKHGQTLKWNPQGERFTGGTGNKAWLDVPHRGIWTV